MHDVTPDRSVDWKISFRLEDGRIFITDRCILIDERYVLPAVLPPDGSKRNYRRVREYLTLPGQERFSFREMKTTGWDNFEAPDGMILNRKYIDFLLERIPDEQLHFLTTEKFGNPVWFFRGDEAVGLLMPMTEPPACGEVLKDKARAGDAEAQYFLGRYYRVEDGPIPRNDILSRKWLEAAAGQDYAKAHLDLGVYHIFGWGGEDDREKAIAYFDKAIELGCREAIPWRFKLMQRTLLTRTELFEEFKKWLEEEEEDGSADTP
jgi:hypothetical protein